MKGKRFFLGFLFFKIYLVFFITVCWVCLIIGNVTFLALLHKHFLQRDGIFLRQYLVSQNYFCFNSAIFCSHALQHISTLQLKLVVPCCCCETAGVSRCGSLRRGRRSQIISHRPAGFRWSQEEMDKHLSRQKQANNDSN